MKTPEIGTWHELLRYRDSLIPLLHFGNISRRQFNGRVERACAIFNAKHQRDAEETQRQIRERAAI